MSKKVLKGNKRLNCKFNLSRRAGKSLWGAAKDPVHKKNYPAGQHGAASAGRKKLGYAQQLEGSQLLRGVYGNIGRKQFRNIIREAIRKKGDSTENLVGLLESRLDSVVYRAKFASSPFAARQLVNHGHIRVNGKKVDISSYRLRPGDVVEVAEKSRDLQVISDSIASGERSVPDYFEYDHVGMKAKYIRIPSFNEVPYAMQMKPSLVIEFFSR